MQTQAIGYLGYKLYCLGWQSGLHGRFSQPQHWLLSIFLYYRRGFTEGSQWIEDYCLSRNVQ